MSKINFQKGNPEDIFRILEPIGEGSFGSVYKAIDKRDSETVALKIMPIETEATDLEKEIAIMEKVKSPYVVNYKGSFKHENNIWIAMEYCGAGSVLDIIRISKINLTEPEIALILNDVLRGLFHVHKIKLLHRDIKAANILLNDKGVCKLADFGVSYILESTLDMAKTMIGSPYWMSPEVFQQGKNYDNKVDIWSLGITAIELAKGRPPLTEIKPMQVMFHIVKNEPPKLEDDEKKKIFCIF